jgi:hypothetical protein
MADGKGCTCCAWNANECACDADWTPQETYDLRKALKAARHFILYRHNMGTKTRAKNRIHALQLINKVLSTKGSEQ